MIFPRASRYLQVEGLQYFNTALITQLLLTFSLQSLLEVSKDWMSVVVCARNNAQHVAPLSMLRIVSQVSDMFCGGNLPYPIHNMCDKALNSANVYCSAQCASWGLHKNSTHTLQSTVLKLLDNNSGSHFTYNADFQTHYLRFRISCTLLIIGYFVS